MKKLIILLIILYSILGGILIFLFENNVFDNGLFAIISFMYGIMSIVTFQHIRDLWKK